MGRFFTTTTTTHRCGIPCLTRKIAGWSTIASYSPCTPRPKSQTHRPLHTNAYAAIGEFDKDLTTMTTTGRNRNASFFPNVFLSFLFFFIRQASLRFSFANLFFLHLSSHASNYPFGTNSKEERKKKHPRSLGHLISRRGFFFYSNETDRRCQLQREFGAAIFFFSIPKAERRKMYFTRRELS